MRFRLVALCCLLALPSAAAQVTTGDFDVRTLAADPGQDLLAPGTSQTWSFTVARTCGPTSVAIETELAVNLTLPAGLTAADLTPLTFAPAACAANPETLQAGSFTLAASDNATAGVHNATLTLVPDSSLGMAGQAAPFPFEVRVHATDEEQQQEGTPGEGMPGPGPLAILAVVGFAGILLRRRS